MHVRDLVPEGADLDDGLGVDLGQTFRRFVTPTPLFSPVGSAYDRWTDEEPAREDGRRAQISDR